MTNFTLILGLGATGYSCARYLAQQNIPFAVNDSRENPPLLEKLQKNFPSAKFVGGKFDGELLERATQIVISPGIDTAKPELIKHRAKIIGDIELFARAVKKPVVGITGSNGKTTVTTLMGEIVKAAGKPVSVCGNIGKPVLDALLDDGEVDFYVVELSSFHLELTDSLKCATAVVMNVTPDHIDRHKNYENYLHAKQLIYRNCARPVLYLDQPEIWQSLNLKNAITFSATNSAAEFNLAQLDTHFLKQKGKHHYENDLAAMAMAHAIGIPKQLVQKVLENFAGLTHRCQMVRELNDVTWYNDSKGTNVGATQTAFVTVGTTTMGKIVWIAGGQGKDADFSVLQPLAAQYARVAILYGEDAPIIAKAMGDKVPVVFAKSLQQAVELAQNSAKSGDAVLFSPACASFDMFANFEERGKCFQKIVDSL